MLTFRCINKEKGYKRLMTFTLKQKDGVPTLLNNYHQNVYPKMVDSLDAYRNFGWEVFIAEEIEIECLNNVG